MKYLLFAFALAFAASPPVPEAEPYDKVDLIIDKAKTQIARSKTAVAEMKAINQKMAIAKAEALIEAKKEAEKMAEKMEVVQRVMTAYSIEVPASVDEWIEDSIRLANMQKINSVK